MNSNERKVFITLAAKLGLRALMIVANRMAVACHVCFLEEKESIEKCMMSIFVPKSNDCSGFFTAQTFNFCSFVYLQNK